MDPSKLRPSEPPRTVAQMNARGEAVSLILDFAKDPQHWCILNHPAACHLVAEGTDAELAEMVKRIEEYQSQAAKCRRHE